jgi:hypothetical protein
LKIKTILKFHLTSVRIASIKNTTNYWQECGENGTLLHSWSDCKSLWKTICRFLRKLKIDLPYDPAIQLLRINPKECNSGYYKSTYTTMFVVALLTRAKLWKQTRCPTTDKWI